MEKNSNVDIFIVTHKSFDCKKTDPVYKILCSEDEDVKSDTVPVIKVPRVLANDGWSELSKIYEIYKDPYTYELKDWVGINHYHRYFNFEDVNGNVPDISKVMDGHMCLITPLIITDSMRIQYGICHNINDFNSCVEVAKRLYPEWSERIDIVADAPYLIASNIVLMRYHDFLDMFGFVFNVLLTWCKEMGINPESDEDFHKRVEDNRQEYLTKYKSWEETLHEQARIPAFLSERLMTIWIIMHSTPGHLLYADLVEE